MGHNRKHQSKGRARRVEKETQPVLKAKRRVDVSTMFQHTRRTRRDAHDIAGDPKPEKTTRGHRLSQPAESSSFRHAFEGTVHAYREGAAIGKVKQLEPAYNELTARVDGEKNDAAASHLATESELEALVHGQIELSDPLDAETTTIKTIRKDGSVGEEDPTLGYTFQSFQDLLDRKRTEFTDLFAKMREVDEQIAAVKEGIRTTEETEVKEVKRKWAAALSRHAEEARRARDEAVAAVDQALQSEQTAAEKDKSVVPRMLNELESKMYGNP